MTTLLPDPSAITTWATQAAAGGAGDNELTYAADADAIHVLDRIDCSFDQTPAAGQTLTVTIGGSAKWVVDLITAGPFTFDFRGGGDNGMHGALGDALVVTLSGDATAASNLNVATR